MLCEKCGKEIGEGLRLCAECENSYEQNKPFEQNNALKYVSIILAALSVVLPFVSWLKVPIAAGLYSFFGMNTAPTTFSLFGYLFAGSQYQTNTVFLITMIIAIIALIGIIFNAIYVIKSFKNNPKRYKYGKIGSIIMIIMSALFIVLVGLMSAILKIIELTFVPYITLVVAIANNLLIKKLKNLI